jgi:hypothetical protein
MLTQNILIGNDNVQIFMWASLVVMSEYIKVFKNKPYMDND